MALGQSDEAQAFTLDVDGGIDVAVVVRLAAGASPGTNRKVVLLSKSTDTAQLAGWEPLVRQDSGFALPVGFVLKHSAEGSVSGIVPGLAVPF